MLVTNAASLDALNGRLLVFRTNLIRDRTGRMGVGSHVELLNLDLVPHVVELEDDRPVSGAGPRRRVAL